jgi:ABC-type multidrug transport system fused ATPase/permease subunit
MAELSTKRVILRLFTIVRPYVGLIVICGLAVVIKEIARVLVFVLVGQALDVVVGASDARLERLLVIEGVLVLCIGVNGFAAVLTMFRAAGHAVHDARRVTVDSILRMPAERTGHVLGSFPHHLERPDGREDGLRIGLERLARHACREGQRLLRCIQHFAQYDLQVSLSCQCIGPSPVPAPGCLA